MSGDRVIVLDGGEMLLGGWFVHALATLAEQQVNAARSRSDGGATHRLEHLVAATREAIARSSAAQLAQLTGDAEAAQFPADDAIEVWEAAEIMDTSTSNVRARCRRGSLLATKAGGQWTVSRTSANAAAQQRGAA